MKVRRPPVDETLAGAPAALLTPHIEDHITAEDIRQARAAVLAEHEMGHRDGQTLDERLMWKLAIRARLNFAGARAEYIEDHNLPESAIPNRGLLPWRGKPPRVARQAE